MKYSHIVKVNGIYYQAGQEVPEIKEVTDNGAEKSAPAVTDADNDNAETEAEGKEAESETEQRNYTRTDISKMNKAELVALANQLGIEGAEENSNNDLKRELVDKLGL